MCKYKSGLLVSFISCSRNLQTTLSVDKLYPCSSHVFMAFERKVVTFMHNNIKVCGFGILRKITVSYKKHFSLLRLYNFLLSPLYSVLNLMIWNFSLSFRYNWSFFFPCSIKENFIIAIVCPGELKCAPVIFFRSFVLA